MSNMLESKVDRSGFPPINRFYDIIGAIAALLEQPAKLRISLSDARDFTRLGNAYVL